MKLLTVNQMRSLEQEADEQGYSYAMMMEMAGKGLAAVVNHRFGASTQTSVLGLVGTGNNGGDTLVALEALAQKGWTTRAYLIKPRDEKDPLVLRLAAAGGIVLDGTQDPSHEELVKGLDSSDVVLDGVLGTGFQLPLKSDLAGTLSFIRDHLTHQVVVAVDCPSGVDCETGETAPEAIPAALTICMGAVKTGLVHFPAFEWVGDLETVDLGLPEDLSAWKASSDMVVDAATTASALPERPRTAHKGTFGTALIVAGSINYTGAAALSARAAYRMGAGLVRLAVPGPLYSPLAGQLPETTWLLLPHEQGVIAENASNVLIENLNNVSALLLGPGWGLDDTTAAFLRQFLLNRKQERLNKMGIGFVISGKNEPAAEDIKIPPLVIDADGLKLLVRIPDWNTHIPKNTILTPHPGEMAVLTGLTVKEIQANRVEIAREFAVKWGQVVVLKGALTVVASPEGAVGIIPVATAALARAGTGDVLAGILVSLRAQVVPAFEAAMAGSWIHAHAGLTAATWFGQEISVMAGDVLDAIPEVLQNL